MAKIHLCVLLICLQPIAIDCMKKIQIMIKNDQYEKLISSKVEGRSMAAHIREIIDYYFEKSAARK